MIIFENIGRFKIIRELGRGSQGVVYLADDPWLERRVAIKTLDISILSEHDRHARLMQEARTASKMHHPNIISVYDAGEYGGKPFLVMEYVEGMQLRALIRQEGSVAFSRSASLMIQILDGIAYAHQQGVIHRDLNPSNILIDGSDIPKIMDFGISVTTKEEKDFSGTPCYMSPEHFSQIPLGPQSDIFSLGLVFYEMLVGQSAFQADNKFAVMYKIANQPLEPPSLKNRTIPRELDGIVMKAADRDLSVRYTDAIKMKQDLETFLSDLNGMNLRKVRPAGDTHSTVEFLLRRMSRKQDFPAFSHNIIEINEKASSSAVNQASSTQIANVILKDLSLTNKLLRLVNSAFYGQTHGKITSVSRAVVVLGFEQVRLAAAGLMLFEHLQDGTQTLDMKDGVLASFMSGLIAKEIARRMKIKGVEEAFICAMLHKLGKHLAMFYLSEEYGEIKTSMAEKGITEQDASCSVLGITFEQLGTAVLRKWNYPEKIVSSMRRVTPEAIGVPKSEADVLRYLANFSNDLCDLINETEGPPAMEDIEALAGRYLKSIPISGKGLKELLRVAKDTVIRYSEVLRIDVERSEFLRRLALMHKSEAADNSATDGPRGGVKSVFDMPARKPDGRSIRTPSAPLAMESENDLHVLMNGIQEITNVLLGKYELNEVISMVLETMYRGFSFNRVIFFLRDRQNGAMNARFGFGQGVKDILGEFNFMLSPTASDIFNLAVFKGRDFIVEDIDDPYIGRHIPLWYRKAVSAPAFLLYPLTVRNQGLGLFYADRVVKGAMISEGQKFSMETLRNQTLFAINQKF